MGMACAVQELAEVGRVEEEPGAEDAEYLLVVQPTAGGGAAAAVAADHGRRR